MLACGAKEFLVIFFMFSSFFISLSVLSFFGGFYLIDYCGIVFDFFSSF